MNTMNTANAADTMNTPNIKAILFDMDGTLVDSELLFCQAISSTLSDVGIEKSSDDLLSTSYGRARSSIYQEIVAEYPDHGISVQGLNETIDRHFDELKRSADIVIANSLDFFKSICPLFPCCVVSGSTRHHLKDFTEILDIVADLAFYLGAEDYPTGKPDPICYLMAAKKLGVDPAQCLVFEDSNVGVRAAKAAGMYCVALKRAGAPEQDVSMADLIVDDLRKFSLDLLPS